jgi:hypothetical protein
MALAQIGHRKSSSLHAPLIPVCPETTGLRPNPGTHTFLNSRHLSTEENAKVVSMTQLQQIFCVRTGLIKAPPSHDLQDRIRSSSLQLWAVKEKTDDFMGKLML